MHNGASGSKRKAAASETDVPAKRSTDVVVPEEMLRTMASSLNAATLALMALPSTDVAARGRVVAVMAECKRQINNVLGIKRRGPSVLAISDVIIDVFHFVRRKELDTLQIVSIRFNAIVEEKISRVCLRMLNSAKISRCSAENQFMLVMDEVGSKKKTRLPTSVDDEAAATKLLFNACQSARVANIELYRTTPMSTDFFDSLALSAPTIFVNEFSMRNRTLSDDVADDKVLPALQSFAELKTVKTEAEKDANLLGCLIRTCFKAGVKLRSDVLVIGKMCDTAVLENALLEFCFGACDEQYAMRDRFVDVQFSKSLKSDFLQRWIEKAEVTECPHKLTLHVAFWGELLPQDTAALGAYKQSHNTKWESRFGSVSGRHWTAICSGDGDVCDWLNFKINH
ncbi:hypothetical protein AAVH_39205 [Aphelenchoides avenae]|nr:hypothetical protein AAVH_39205 [Aphelenchus avenae]